VQLCESSPDYNRPLFDQPLAECHFSEYNIDTAFTGRSLPMTPLFSQTQTSGTQETGSQALFGSQSQTGGRTQQQAQPPAGMVRATQGPSLSLSQGGTFAPSLTQGDFVSSSLMATQSAGFRGGFTQGSGTTQRLTQGFGSAQRGGSLWDTQTNIQRRILKTRTSQVVQSVLGARRRREARERAQAGARAHKVTMMRSYRVGELPDIEIKTSDVLRPLTALAERDPLVARTLSAGIFKAAFTLPDTPLRDTENDVKRPVREGIVQALARTRARTSFVASLHLICLEDPKMWLNPRGLGDASLKSMNYHSGIMVLENQLLNQSFNDDQEVGSRSKRQKGRGGQAVPRGSQGEGAPRGSEEKEDAWLQLARLYREIGEDDIVLGVLQVHFNTFFRVCSDALSKSTSPQEARIRPIRLQIPIEAPRNFKRQPSKLSDALLFKIQHISSSVPGSSLSSVVHPFQFCILTFNRTVILPYLPSLAAKLRDTRPGRKKWSCR
jgi:DNA-dependent protein kinase catalytic subunit